MLPTRYGSWLLSLIFSLFSAMRSLSDLTSEFRRVLSLCGHK